MNARKMREIKAGLLSASLATARFLRIVDILLESR